MVLPEEIGDAAQDEDLERVKAWLQNGGSVDDQDAEGYTLLHCCACGRRVSPYSCIRAGHVSIARHLLALGAAPEIPDTASGGSPLLAASRCHGEASADMVRVLLDAGADANFIDKGGDRPLWEAIKNNDDSSEGLNRALLVVRMLIRAGASLDCPSHVTAEVRIQGNWGSAPWSDDERVVAMRTLVEGVRAAGTWAAYAKLPRKRVLRLRSLVARGRAKDPTDPIVARVFRLPNELCWHVLQFWRATDATGEVF